MTQYVYGFSQRLAQAGDPSVSAVVDRESRSGSAVDDKADRLLLGGKGAGLYAMCRLGLPVPPGFTLSTAVCHYVSAHGVDLYPAELAGQIEQALAAVEAEVGARFGDPEAPLLLSVRSGAPVSMPGMMDTILNLGLNDQTVEGLARSSGDRRFAFDSYRRFLQMYGEVVLGVRESEDADNAGGRDPFESLLHEAKARAGVDLDSELSAAELEALCGAFKEEVRRHTGSPFPQDVRQQLQGAITAVFRSWDNPRAVTYRKLYSIPRSYGTAVTVQAMVFGNLGDDCATGVAFTRDPSTGERRFYGEFLVNAQGEDVVAGIRTPQPVDALSQVLPAAAAELRAVAERLEQHFRDMQDIEFTIQRGKLWMLQTRSGKRSGRAMVRIAVAMAEEGLITTSEAVLRVEPGKLEELLHPMIDPGAEKRVIARGLPASPGAATGKLVFSAAEAEAAARRDERVILVRTETSPEDIHGMQAAQGILTARGGMTSHAAVVARGMGKCCVVGAGALQVDAARQQVTCGGIGAGLVLKRNDVVTLDGNSGEVLLGAMPMTAARIEQDASYQALMGFVDKARRLQVRANADTPLDARTARRFGAQGIGLCRTEHMFFQPDRLLAVRQMILAETEAGRRRALEKILPMQRGDFAAIFTEMDGLPVTIRLLDPPLHEFLPRTAAEIAEVAAALGVAAERVALQNDLLHEHNPMLGHRGCRLGVTYPEIYEVQVQAILEAAAEAAARGVVVHPEIMIPLVGQPKELALLRALAAEVAARLPQPVRYSLGTMIELPRACVAAGEIAAEAEFFSFGTNDLTQTTLGLSRDDAGRFLPRYVELGIYPEDPFVSLDVDGVGALVAMAVERGRAARPGLKVGICGEHGGDPASVAFFDRAGLDYVSCSPFRVPIARLAAAQAALRR